MSQLYIRLYSSFWNHRKTIKLFSLIGEAAYWVPPKLWSYAVEHQPDGDFSKYEASDLALILAYSKDATSMLQALIKVGYMTEKLKINDWEEHNDYHHKFSVRAAAAAHARWKNQKASKKEDKEKDIDKDKEKEQAMGQHAPSIFEPKKSFKIKIPLKTISNEDWLIELKKTFEGVNVDVEITKMKAWLLSPRGAGRRLTRNFITDWLNRSDRLVNISVPQKPRHSNEELRAAELAEIQKQYGVSK